MAELQGIKELEHEGSFVKEKKKKGELRKQNSRIAVSLKKDA